MNRGDFLRRIAALFAGVAVGAKVVEAKIPLFTAKPLTIYDRWTEVGPSAPPVEVGHRYIVNWRASDGLPIRYEAEKEMRR